jgi:hypothetical protein
MIMTQTQNRRILNWTHNIQGDLRVIMSPTELRMQPTIHLERKAGYGRGKCPVLGTFQMYYS